jgi:hypothetical protein
VYVPRIEIVLSLQAEYRKFVELKEAGAKKNRGVAKRRNRDIKRKPIGTTIATTNVRVGTIYLNIYETAFGKSTLYEKEIIKHYIKYRNSGN